MISPSSPATSLMKYFIREYFSTVKYFIMHASMLCPRAFAPPSPRLCLRACACKQAEKRGGGITLSFTSPQKDFFLYEVLLGKKFTHYCLALSPSHFLPPSLSLPLPLSLPLQVELSAPV